MDQRISFVTLGVSDYPRAKRFYQALGWTPTLDIQDTAFYTTNGAVLVLWGREKLAADTGVRDEGARWAGITLAHNVASRDDVDQVIKQARAQGAEITRQPAETFYGGYAGVFCDLDGHAWEVAHNPSFGLDEHGNILLTNSS
jgi:uncharacterized protein